MEQESSRFITASDILFFFSILQQLYNVSVGIRRHSRTAWHIDSSICMHKYREDYPGISILLDTFSCYRYLVGWISSNELVASRMRENKRFIKRYMLQGSDNDKIPWFDLVHPVADRFR